MKLKKLIPEIKTLSFNRVKPGMYGVDYADNPGKVIRTGKLSDFSKFKRWDQIGWLDNEKSITDHTGIEKDEFDQVNIIAVDLDDYGVGVFIYGDEGFIVPIKK